MTDTLVIIRFTIKQRQTFEDRLNVSFQGKLWLTFPLDRKSQKSNSQLQNCL